MLDFPASPTNGQTFTGPNGIQWQFDGQKWLAGTGTTVYAPITDAALLGNPTAPTPPAGDADTSIATTAFVTNAVATSLHDVGRNYLHNSMFNVAQRGAGAFTSGQYTLDRWATAYSTDTWSFSQQPLADNYRASIGDEEAAFCLANTNFVGNGAAGSYHYIHQRIENVRRLAGKTVTVSFYALCGAGTPKFGVNLYQDFGTGGSPSAQVQVPGQSVTISTTFTRYSLTFTLPSISGKTLGTNNNNSTWLNFWYSCGATYQSLSGGVPVQSGTIWLWGVQLEIGPTATPLEKLDPVTQLQQCQRFYCTGQVFFAGYATTTLTVACSTPVPVTMRGTMAPVITGNFGSGVSGHTISAIAGGVFIQGTTTATGGWVINSTYTVSADL